MKSLGCYLFLFPIISLAGAFSSSSLFSYVETAPVASDHDNDTIHATNVMVTTGPLVIPSTLGSHTLVSGLPLNSVGPGEYRAPSIRTDAASSINTATVTGPFGYPLHIAKTTLATSTVTYQVTATILITVRGPFGHPLPMPNTDLFSSTEKNQVVVTAQPGAYETSSGTLDKSTRRDNIIFGVVGVVIAFGAFAVGVVTYKLAKKTYKRNQIRE